MNSEHDSPEHLAFGMLPIRTVSSPKKTLLNDCIRYEYPVIGAVALGDDLAWQPLQLEIGNHKVRFLKPQVSGSSVLAPGGLDEHSLDVRWTIFTLETDLVPEEESAQPLDLYPLVTDMIHIFRTIGRQYWVGLAMANEGSLIAATRTRIENGLATFFG